LGPGIGYGSWLAMAFTKSAPALSCSRAARRQPSAPSASMQRLKRDSRHTHTHTGEPHATIRGPSSSSRATRSRTCSAILPMVAMSRTVRRPPPARSNRSSHRRLRVPRHVDASRLQSREMSPLRRGDDDCLRRQGSTHALDLVRAGTPRQQPLHPRSLPSATTQAGREVRSSLGHSGAREQSAGTDTAPADAEAVQDRPDGRRVRGRDRHAELRLQGLGHSMPRRPVQLISTPSHRLITSRCARTRSMIWLGRMFAMSRLLAQ
jgi:hypothetical protein